MSWALHAASSPSSGAMDVTPLAATLRAQTAAGSAFFPRSSASPASASQPPPSLAQQEDDEFQQALVESGTISPYSSSPQVSARGRALQQKQQKAAAAAQAAALEPALQTVSSSSNSSSAASLFHGTSLTSNIGEHQHQQSRSLRPSASALAASSSASRPNLTSSASAVIDGGLPLHAQQALRDEVAHLHREVARSEQRLAEKDASLSKLAAALHAMEAAKLEEHAKSRVALKEARKALVDSESRLAFVQSDLTQRHSAEAKAIQKNNAAMMEGANALLDAVSHTIRSSASAQIGGGGGTTATTAPAASHASSASSFSGGQSGSGSGGSASFTGAGSGLSHDEHLKSVLAQFARERMGWDKAHAGQIASLKEEHRSALGLAEARCKALKQSYQKSYAAWKAQFASQCSEIDFLSEYIAKLTYLLEEIDRGCYPVLEKHGVKSFVIPAHKRAFLRMDLQATQLSSGVMQRKLAELKSSLARAGVHWEPREMGTDQSYLSDHKQLRLREAQQQQQQQLRLTAGSEDEDEEGNAQDKQLSLRPEEAKEEESADSRSSFEEEEAQARRRAAMESTLLDELASHETVAYITALESERDRFRALFEAETRRRHELHATMTSQNRILQGLDMFQAAHANAIKQTPGISTVGGPIAASPPHQAAASKVRGIVAASATMATNATAGKLGVNIGYVATAAAAGSQAQQQTQQQQVGMSSGHPFDTLSALSAVSCSPSRPVDAHTFGGVAGSHAHTNANLGAMRPGSAKVYRAGLQAPPKPVGHAAQVAAANAQQQAQQQQHLSYSLVSDSSRPISAVSAATTSYLGVSRATTAGASRPARPMSAFSAAVAASAPTSAGNTSRVVSAGGSAGLGAYASIGAAHFPKPSPLHMTHGNASTTLFAHQLAKQSHQDNRDAMLGITAAAAATSGANSHAGSSANTPGSTSRTPQPARSRAASAGRGRPQTPVTVMQ